MASRDVFAFSYGAFRPLLTVMGFGPRFRSLTVSGDELSVRFGWGFSARIPLAAISHAGLEEGLVGGIGVHGFRGRWLVNGAATGLVGFDVEPPVRASVMGVPITLRHLRVSLEDPNGFLARLAA
jgi:hypothetical protein